VIRCRSHPGRESERTLIIRVGQCVWWGIGGVLLAALTGGLLAVVVRSPLPLDAWAAHPRASLLFSLGEVPFPVRPRRPPVAPLSAMAQLGRQVFFDASLSSSRRLSCASCHSPEHAYGPPGDDPVMAGRPTLSRQGLRAVPSLMYLERQPNFSVGPDDDEIENVSLAQLAAQSFNAPRAKQTARDTRKAPPIWCRRAGCSGAVGLTPRRARRCFHH
jgi:cytochrome c peroxidase